MSNLPNHSTIEQGEIVFEPTYNISQTDLQAMLKQMMNMNAQMIMDIFDKKLTNSNIINIYSTADLCRIYHVSESTIYNYRTSGRLHYCSDGQNVWFTQEHIDEFNWLTDSRNKKTRSCKMA
jgi:hypothetical protein